MINHTLYRGYSKADIKKAYKQGRADAIDEVLNNCSKEYQVWSDDSVCKIWLSELEQLKEKNNDTNL